MGEVEANIVLSSAANNVPSSSDVMAVWACMNQVPVFLVVSNCRLGAYLPARLDAFSVTKPTPIPLLSSIFGLPIVGKNAPEGQLFSPCTPAL